MIFVEEMLLEEAEFDTRVPICRFPDPVALVKVMPVEETVVAKRVPTVALPARVIVPVDDTRNWVDEFTWKFMKSPEKAVGLMPIYVPDAALPPWMILGPRRKRELVAIARGFASMTVLEERVVRPETFKVEPITT